MDEIISEAHELLNVHVKGYESTSDEAWDRDPICRYCGHAWPCDSAERDAVIAALLERAVTAEADRGEAERRERTAVNLANYHRDVARTAGGRAEHAEAEARQLREAIEDRLRQVLAVHGQFLGDWDEWTSLGALEGYNGLTVTARTALAHLHGRHDDSPLPTMHCVLCETFRVPAVAEGAEDRGQTDG